MLGGAPFNVAWNLQGLGHDPIFLSAVGQDSEAEQVRQKMSRHGMDLLGLQSNTHPTGKVQVSFADGEPSYEIVPDQAYDFIRDDLDSIPMDDVGIVYHGSLIWRSACSRQTVTAIRARSQARVFVDLNLRPPWFNADWLVEILPNVDSLKLNVDELGTISGKKCEEPSSIFAAAQYLQHKYQVRAIWVTAGAQGAYWIGENDAFEFAETPRIASMVDTVGAGDAFSSAVIDGILRGHQPRKILAVAVRFAARVCQMRGATSDSPDFYDSEIDGLGTI